VTYAEIERVEKLERKIERWNEMIESLITRRDQAQGRLDELMQNRTLDKERMRKNVDLYRARIEKLESLLEG
jgi:response regulator of citrate/malate metabolism